MDVGGAAGCLVHLGEFLARCVEADLQALGFAGPAFAFGLADPGDQAVADLYQAGTLGRVNAKEGAPFAAFSELTV